jgi:hypothetical protein
MAQVHVQALLQQLVCMAETITTLTYYLGPT